MPATSTSASARPTSTAPSARCRCSTARARRLRLGQRAGRPHQYARHGVQDAVGGVHPAGAGARAVPPRAVQLHHLQQVVHLGRGAGRGHRPHDAGQDLHRPRRRRRLHHLPRRGEQLPGQPEPDDVEHLVHVGAVLELHDGAAGNDQHGAATSGPTSSAGSGRTRRPTTPRPTPSARSGRPSASLRRGGRWKTCSTTSPSPTTPRT